MSSIIHWIEIPTKDIERATTFYSTVLNIKMRKFMQPWALKLPSSHITIKHTAVHA